MQKRFLVIGGVVLLVAVVVAIFVNHSGLSDTENSGVTTPVEDPLDVVLDFYTNWLELAKSTTTSPYESDLINSPLLTEAVRTKVSKKPTEGGATSLDLVLCQPNPPMRIGAKVLYQLDTEAEFIILARGEEEKSSHQAIVKVLLSENAWQIVNIACATGETPPVHDFAFEREGFLLKSVPPPLNPEFWHLVFEQDGVMGHTVPLFFSTESLCISTNGTESICDTTTFTDATKVFIQADMSESGAQVKQLRLIE